MFSKNISAIALTNPDLANILSDTDLPKMQVVESESKDLNLVYKEIPLHSLANPITEAEEIFSSIVFKENPSSVHIVYGLGLGYLFKRVYVSVPGRVILFEPNLEVLRFTLEFVDFSQEFQDKRVFICTSVQELLDVIKAKYLIGDKLELCCLPSYLSLDPQYANSFIEDVLNLIKSKQQDQSTLLSKSEDWAIASVQNIDNIMQSVPCDILKDKFKDLPAVVVSAGPTLEENIELIKANRTKFILITVNTALKALLKNDIIPDFCVVSENFDISYQFKGLKNLDKINFILSTRVKPFLWELGLKPNIVYFTQTDGLSQFVKRHTSNISELWPSAGSVSINAFYISTIIFGCNPVVLVGQDLAFVNNQFYSKSVLDDGEQIQIESGKIVPQLESSERSETYTKLKTQTVKNQHGEDLLTGKDYYEYINQYEDILKNELPENITVINTSIKGAFIKGMSYDNFENVLTSISKSDITLNLPFNQLEGQYKMYEISSKELKLILTKDINALIDDANRLIHLINKYMNAYKSPNLSNTISDTLNKFYALKKDFSNKLSSNDLIFFMIQKHSMEYINSYLIPDNDRKQSKEDINKNLNTEFIFLNKVKQSLTNCKNKLIS